MRPEKIPLPVFAPKCRKCPAGASLPMVPLALRVFFRHGKRTRKYNHKAGSHRHKIRVSISDTKEVIHGTTKAFSRGT